MQLPLQPFRQFSTHPTVLSAWDMCRVVQNSEVIGIKYGLCRQLLQSQDLAGIWLCADASRSLLPSVRDKLTHIFSSCSSGFFGDRSIHCSFGGWAL